MKKRFFLPILAASMTITSCGLIPGTSLEVVDVGEVAVEVPQYGQSAGVTNAIIHTSGRRFYNGYSSEMFRFPTTTKTYNWTQDPAEGSPNDESVNFPVAGVRVDADVALSFNYLITADPDNDPGTGDAEWTHLHTYLDKYNKPPEDFIDAELRNGVRSCLTSSSQALGLTPLDISRDYSPILTATEDCLKGRFGFIGITELTFIGEVRLPKEQAEKIREQEQARQAAQTAEFERQRTEAEGRTRVAQAQAEAEVELTEARATAEANRLIADSVTPELVQIRRLEAEIIEAQNRYGENWNGQLPSNIVQSNNAQVAAPQQ